ncbi:FAD/NAD(P)-binding domain-containing protein [Guyanagaster necrorhizus]|uniref:NADPH:adrenodoxin oxidoreductase, mitochondrial n=1 Tax=Guyanagaster necrorhizus TaxID=856835 RepID=A0A9P7VSA7_9AGAR|nr:FAD/NAD(P)-binding domain-containing protein [Guyanagaster necrorhizus MCA 3950]KAG7445922.1 FAD/NAD(P)-binding domain-containing protein [Guyanagaster necrorhizus MCA 3950]
MKLAIVGGGASAFYVASRLLSRLPQDAHRIHVFDRLWAPHGLVRYGVAPDHPEVKNCTHKFDHTATDPRFRFFGNVNIQHQSEQMNVIQHAVQLPLSSLYANYTHLLFASGCPLPTLHPALPPSSHCIPALNVVHWYTQHPSLPAVPPLERLKHVTLIGNGNVSLDVARMLLTPPDMLRPYDVPESVMSVLERSTIEHVSIVARRGPFDAAFTTKELREMMNIRDASMAPIPPELLVVPTGKEVSRAQSRSIQLMQKGSKNPYGSTKKTWSLEFFRSPVGLASEDPLGPAELSLAHTTIDPANPRRAIPTGETSRLSTDLVITSLGFHADDSSSPFHDSSLGHLRTEAGRVIVPDLPGGKDLVSGSVLKNMYASGWASMGAKGVLAATMMDAYAVADTILSDLDHGDASEGVSLMNPNPHPTNPPPEIDAAAGSVVGYEDWKKIDQEEISRGESLGKERTRMGWQEARELLGRTT